MDPISIAAVILAVTSSSAFAAAASSLAARFRDSRSKTDAAEAVDELTPSLHDRIERMGTLSNELNTLSNEVNAELQVMSRDAARIHSEIKKGEMATSLMRSGADSLAELLKSTTAQALSEQSRKERPLRIVLVIIGLVSGIAASLLANWITVGLNAWFANLA